MQSVTLKRFDPCWQLHPDAQLHYELWRGLPDGGQQLLYVSEQVGAYWTSTVACSSCNSMLAYVGTVHAC